MTQIRPIALWWLVASWLSVATLAGADSARPGPDLGPWPDKLELRALLHGGDFEALEQRLTGYQRAFEADPRLEAHVWHAFDSFRDLGSEDGTALESWPARMPESYAARVALARHYHSRAWMARGGGSANKTSEKQFSTMHGFAERANALAREALDLNSQLVVAYQLQIGIARLIGDAEIAKAALAAALKIEPSLFGVREEYMLGITRRWRGSYDALAEFAEDSQPFAQANPQLRVLLGMSHWDRGRDFASAKQYADAVDAYTSALAYEAHHRYLNDRGWAHHRLKNETLALDDLSRAVALRPHHPPLLSRRAAVYLAMGMPDPATADWELALALDPLDAYYAKQLERAKRSRVRKDFLEDPTADKLIGFGAAFLLSSSVLGGAGLLVFWIYRRIRVRAGALPDPSDSLAIDPTQPLGFRIWRLYLWLISLIHLGLYATRWSALTDIDRFLDVPITCIALLGALGYVQRWRLIHVRLWQLWAFVFPCWNVTLHFAIQHAELHMWPAWGFAHLICAPVYAALFVYGFHSKAIWGELDQIPLVYRDEPIEQQH